MDSDVMRTGPEGYQTRRDKMARGIESAASEAGEMVKDVGNRIGNKLQDAKTTFAQAQTTVTDTARQAAQYTDDYVRMNPWKSLGIAAIAGLLVGVLLARR
jgi:ElaB/YqjD/DUF883 family membrane-anchored ribosome-binding protein